MRIMPEDSLLFVIDMQEKLVRAMYEKEKLEERTLMLIRGVHGMEIPIMLSQQYTRGLGGSLPAVYDAAGSSRYFEKSSFSCWRDDDIRQALHDSKRRNILIAGTEAHVCVLQTCIDLKADGFEPVLVTDCIGSRRENDREYGIRRAMQEGITVTTAEAILFELLQDSKSPYFKKISGLVK